MICARHRSFLAFLPVIAEALLDAIVLLDSSIILAVFTLYKALLPSLTLNLEIGSELDLACTALGQLVRLVVWGYWGTVLFLVLPRSNRTGPLDEVGDL
jgi:hypothetical protein